MTGVRGEYRVAPLPRGLATRLVVEHHYLHRPAPCEAAFGLVHAATGDVRGVVVYGTPSSAPLRSGIAGPENAGNVIELTRLWVADDVPKNGESYLIGNTVRRCGKEIVVSFAEIEQGHLGVVYQATNWLYTGLSAKRTDWHVEPTIEEHDLFGQPVLTRSKHGQTWADGHTAEEIRQEYGDRFTLRPRGRKHRYVFLNGSRTRRRQLLAQLRYPVLPYPKRSP